MNRKPVEGSIPFARPSITDREIRAVTEVLESGWLTTGPRANAFEAAFAARVGARHAVAVNSATAALHLALEAVGVVPGDDVIVPTWTFTASAEVVTYLGARPRLVDVEHRSLNASVETILGAVTQRTRAVVAVHFAGRPLEIGRLVDELTPRGIAVIEDAAHAFPSQLPDMGGRHAGQVGAAGAFSFYATKTITTGEGGMLVTDRDDIAARARTMSLHGISRDAWKRYRSDGSWSYEVVAPGFKYNLTDIAAALGLIQLDRAYELLDERRRLKDRYRVAFLAADTENLIDLPEDAPGHAWHLFVIRLRLDAITVDRAAVIAALQERGIGASVHFIPLHRHPYYRDHVVLPEDRFLVADTEFPRVVSLPLWPGLSNADIDRVVEEVVSIVRKARR